METFADGVVVNDGHYLWTAASVGPALLGAANESPNDGDADGTYAALCDATPYLLRTDPARHARIVAAWRERHHRAGNWTR